VAFKSMKKKTEHTSKSCRRSAVEDFRACYMHLYMIFILLTSVLCAVAQRKKKLQKQLTLRFLYMAFSLFCSWL